MRQLAIAFLGAALCLSATRAHAGKTVTVGGATVTIPDGWKQTPGEGGTVVLTPENLSQGVTCTYTLLGGEPFDGSLKDRLISEWKEFEKVGRIVYDDGGTLQGGSKPGQATVASRSGTIDTDKAQGVKVWLVITQVNGRIERSVFVTGSADEFTKYGAAVAAMINGTVFIPPKPAEPLRGVCFGFARVKTGTWPECWIFLDDGIVFHGFPIGGPAHASLEAQARRNPGDLGEYHTAGGEVLVTLKGQKEPTRFTESNGAWVTTVTRQFTDRRQITRFEWTHWTEDVPSPLRIERVGSCDGLRIEGTYRLDALPSKYEPRPIPTIRFTADGKFSEDGLIHDADPGTLDKPTIMPATGGRGTYSIGKNTLELSYDNGTKLNLTFLATNAELTRNPPGEVFLHATRLLLVP
jgi:hypothetical protein